MKKIDVFAAVNLVLFLVLCVFRYYARFIAYRGAEHIEEFFLYAVVILAAIVALWWVFRQHWFDGTILTLVQIGILMHFAGAFIPIDGGRLYDAHLLGIRYDKYVHLVNAFTVTMLVSRLFQIQRIPLTLVNGVFLLGAVLGFGAFIEIVEYLAVLTVPKTMVGGYDNNMQDLIANLCGSLSFVMARLAWGRFRRSSYGVKGRGVLSLSPVPGRGVHPLSPAPGRGVHPLSPAPGRGVHPLSPAPGRGVHPLSPAPGRGVPPRPAVRMHVRQS